MNRTQRIPSYNIGTQQNVQFFSFMNETFELFENYVKMNQKIIARFQILKEVGKSFEIDFMSKNNDNTDLPMHLNNSNADAANSQENNDGSNFLASTNEKKKDLVPNDVNDSPTEIFNDNEPDNQNDHETFADDCEANGANEDAQCYENGLMTNSSNSDNRFVYNNDSNYQLQNVSYLCF